MTSANGEAAVPRPESPQLAVEPEIEIKVRDNGPYKVTGAVRLTDAEGNELTFDASKPLVLCRCGRSQTKPFCDASHKDANFQSCVRAEPATGPRHAVGEVKLPPTD